MLRFMIGFVAGATFASNSYTQATWNEMVKPKVDQAVQYVKTEILPGNKGEKKD